MSYSWLSDSVHEILGYSENTIEQFIIRTARDKEMKTWQIINAQLIEKLDFPDVENTSALSKRLYS